MTFKDFTLTEPILKALESEGYKSPTPIQEKSIPIILSGKDLLGCAQTGTGKTAAFAIPILQVLHERVNPGKKRPIRALILSPTRELAIQINDSLAAYGKNTHIKHNVIFGGVSQKAQVESLSRGLDILVATPGRLNDLINQGFISLSAIEVFVLDEADKMLDMGFVHDVKKIIGKLPAKRQTLFFSATMEKGILKLAETILKNPEKVQVAPVSSVAETIQQEVYFVEGNNKRNLLKSLLEKEDFRSVLIFTRTKHGADRLTKDLGKIGFFAEAIHGNKSQNARQRALTNFKNGKTSILIATDIAARGIDVEDLGLVINFEIPNQPETYVHRIGRTGRAGSSGKAISFCASDERDYLKDIQKLSASIKEIKDHPFVSDIKTPVSSGQGKTPKKKIYRRRIVKSAAV